LPQKRFNAGRSPQIGGHAAQVGRGHPLLNGFECSVNPGLRTPVDHHFRAFRCQRRSDGPADPSRRAGHHREFPLQSEIHFSL